MNGQRFHQQKRIEMKTEQCERILSYNVMKLMERNRLSRKKIGFLKGEIILDIRNH